VAANPDGLGATVDDGFVVWLTGLSGAGKTTIADELAVRLRATGQLTEVLDGDEIRQTLSRGLGFSRSDRETHIRRIIYVATLLARNRVAVVVAAISPYRGIRAEARAALRRFVEVHVTCPVPVLARRDTKGLYARAFRGELGSFTGVSDPYEAPLDPDVVVRTDRETIDESVGKVVDALCARGFMAGASLSGVGPPAH
jgi:adenylyl-sulfate kinase